MDPIFRGLGRSFTVALSLAALTSLALAGDDSFRPGAVYTQTNSPSGNEVAIFDRAVDGVLTFSGFVATGGSGTGAALGNQGAVRLSENESLLFVTNAASNDVSMFRVDEFGLTLLDVQSTRGAMPISVDEHDGVVYVVNEGDDTIEGFRVNGSALDFVPGSRRRLGLVGTAPAQIEFGPNGDSLFVTEKATNRITSFALNLVAVPTQRLSVASPSPTPFGFALGLRDQLFVSEASGGAAGAGTVSSLLADGFASTPISASIATTQTATCWVVATPDGRLIYVSNTADATVSSFAVGFDGTLTLIDPLSATTGAGPRDMAVTRDGRFFYVLNEAAGSIGDYRIASDSSLVSLPGSNNALQPGASGLAAR